MRSNPEEIWEGTCIRSGAIIWCRSHDILKVGESRALMIGRILISSMLLCVLTKPWSLAVVVWAAKNFLWRDTGALFLEQIDFHFELIFSSDLAGLYQRTRL